MRSFFEALVQGAATLFFLVVVIGIMVVLAGLGAILIPAAIGGFVAFIIGAVIWDAMK